MKLSMILKTGELIGSSEMIRLQLAVPPRVSGPYEGYHNVCLLALAEAYANILPNIMTPCPPKPAAFIFNVFIKHCLQCL